VGVATTYTPGAKADASMRSELSEARPLHIMAPVRLNTVTESPALSPYTSKLSVNTEGNTEG